MQVEIIRCLKDNYSYLVIDKQRIPSIDILLEDNQIWKGENFEAKIIHIPGHTSGHICFYFIKEKIAFTGDTLFSLGCGRIFEGTYEQMLNSLNLIKTFPKHTKIYCGHEYTLKNSEFCLKNDEENLKLKEKIILMKEKLSHGTPTIPTTLKEELECNIFLRSDNELIQKNLNTLNELDTFSKLRDLKDIF